MSLALLTSLSAARDAKVGLHVERLNAFEVRVVFSCAWRRMSNRCALAFAGAILGDDTLGVYDVFVEWRASASCHVVIVEFGSEQEASTFERLARSS